MNPALPHRAAVGRGDLTQPAVLFSLFGLALPHVDLAQQKVSRAVVRIEVHGLAEVVGGGLQPLELVERAAQLEQGTGRGRSLLQGLQRVGEAALAY